MEKFLFLTHFLIQLVAITFIICYIPRLRCWLQPIKKQKRIVSEKKNKLALIIPARNESKAILPLLESIDKQTYDRNNFDFYVLVKDSNDQTIEMTKNHGGYVHVIPNQTCKGDALDVSMQKILLESPDVYDAFIIVDADCILDKKFLEEMNNSLASGAKVVGAKKIVKNYLSNDENSNSLWSACNGLIWSIIDDLGNRYKSDNNITIMTIGTGLMITSDLIKELGGWPYRQTLTEDIELMYDCMYNDVKTFYYSYAKVYVEEATSLSVTNKRRTRWLTGVVDSKKIYNSRIKSKRRTLSGIINYYFTTALIPVYGFVGFLTLAFLLTIALSVLLLLCGNHLFFTSIALSAECFLIVYTSFLILTIACLFADGKTIKLSISKKILLVLVHPLFYMGYITIIAKALLGVKNKGWEIIDRVDFSDINGDECDDPTASNRSNT